MNEFKSKIGTKTFYFTPNNNDEFLVTRYNQKTKEFSPVTVKEFEEVETTFQRNNIMKKLKLRSFD